MTNCQNETRPAQAPCVERVECDYTADRAPDAGHAFARPAGRSVSQWDEPNGLPTHEQLEWRLYVLHNATCFGRGVHARKLRRAQVAA